MMFLKHIVWLGYYLVKSLSLISMFFWHHLWLAVSSSIGGIAFLCHSAFTAQQAIISVANKQSICFSLMHYMLTGMQLDLAPGHVSCLGLFHAAHIFLEQWETWYMHILRTFQAFAISCLLTSHWTQQVTWLSPNCILGNTLFLL